MMTHGISMEAIHDPFLGQLPLPTFPAKEPRRLLWVDGVSPSAKSPRRSARESSPLSFER